MNERKAKCKWKRDTKMLEKREGSCKSFNIERKAVQGSLSRVLISDDQLIGILRLEIVAINSIFDDFLDFQYV